MDPIDPVLFTLVGVIAILIHRDHNDQQAYGHADSQTKDIDQAKGFIPYHVPPGDYKVVFEHERIVDVVGVVVMVVVVVVVVLVVIVIVVVIYVWFSFSRYQAVKVVKVGESVIFLFIMDYSSFLQISHLKSQIFDLISFAFQTLHGIQHRGFEGLGTDGCHGYNDRDQSCQ
jgi:hypothetical protein